MIDYLKNIYRIYGYFYFKIWVLHLLVLCSIFFIDIKYFLYSVCVFLLYMPLMQLITHEYVSHEYIQPKNKWIDLLCLLLFYSQENNVQAKRDFHVMHHRHWKNVELDPAQQKMKNIPIWRYILSLQRPVEQNIIPVQNAMLENNIWVKMLNKHSQKIYWLYVSIMFLTLPLEWFFVMCIYFPWLGVIVFFTHDQVFHGKIKSKDHNWYLPIFGSQSWHIYHHENYDKCYHGPTFWKWLNPAWYYQLLLFKTNTSCLK